MNISAIAPMLRTADMSLSEKAIASAQVILTGFVVVFIVLILLILIIKLFSFIIQKAQQGGKNKIKEESMQQEEAASAQVKSAVTQENFDGVPEEVVAVISAAVADIYGSSAKTRIKSIKKSNGGRSAWANAGVLDNTRPF